MRKQTERISLLWEAASVLLTTEEPDAMMRGLFAKVARHFGLDAYFNFMINDTGDALLLESCPGIPEETAHSIRQLGFGIRAYAHLGNAFTIPAGKDAVVQFAGTMPHGLEEGCQR